MIPTYLSTTWPMVAPAIGNHLWQSTLCLVVAGLLTLVFRQNHARVRYGLWLAASIKFLIPFSLLIILGNNLAKPRVVYQTETGFMTAMQEASQPFTLPAAHVPSPVAFSPTPPSILPAILAAIWLCGFAAVLILWFVRWQRISSIVRHATPLREGRELTALRRVERWAGVRKPIEFVSSQAALEPGIFGIFKPVLIWPQRISPKLEDAHLEAILAHEVWHVRRRDNLASSIHMLVEAIFCFHPMVWWLGSRLVEERERASDEEVLMLGSNPNIYAESILKICEFCVESPLACVSGVTGADLKKRIVHIMTDRVGNKLSFRGKLLLASVGLAVIAGPVVFGLVNGSQMRAQSMQRAGAPLPSFEVASVKANPSGDPRVSIRLPPGRFTATNVTAKMLVEYAYTGKQAGFSLRDDQVSGGPSWIESERYDIDAKVEDSLVKEEAQRLPYNQWADQIRLMLQSLLADRFKLKVSYTSKELPVFALVVARNGPRLTASAVQPVGPPGSNPPGAKVPSMTMGSGEITGVGKSVAALADLLSRQPELEGREVKDETALKGTYDFSLHWTSDQSQPTTFKLPSPATESAPPPESSDPSLFTAIQEQLGLKLESTKAPVEVLVIDHIERPSEN